MEKEKSTIGTVFHKYEFLLTSLIILTSVFFLTVYLMVPNIYKARDILENGKVLREKLKALENKNRILSGIDDNSLKSNYVKLNYVMPQSKDYVLLFTTLDQLQQKLGVSITRTDFELGSVSTASAQTRKNGSGDPFAVPVSLEIIGTVSQLENFLMSMSDLSGRLISADKINLNFTEAGIVSAQISGKTYFNPLPKSIGAVDSVIPEFNDNYQAIFKRILENQYPLAVIQESEAAVPLGKENLFN